MRVLLEEKAFFVNRPEALPLYQRFVERLHSEFADVTIRMKKTQISFSNKHIFAVVSLPFRKIKSRPAIYIIVSFGLNHRVKHPRIIEAVEPYPNHWTHHTLVVQKEDVDDVLMNWIRSAYVFSMIK